MTKSKFSILSIVDLLWRGVRATGRMIRHAVPRVYGLAMLLVICWLTFLSIRYLVRSLLVPTQTPEQIVGIPRRMEPELLATERDDWRAITAAETPRVPPAHYHRVDSWIEPDSLNDCTRSGCHGPLPHAKNKAVRAFLNMHATSIHCGVCHMATDDHPLKMTWYDLDTGAAQASPAILRLYQRLTEINRNETEANALKEQHRELVALIQRTAKDLPNASALEQLVEHFEAVRPGSKAYQRLLDETQEIIPRYFRGEYGAKLALKAEDGAPILAHPETSDDVAKYLAQGNQLAPEQRDQLLEKIHPLRRDSAYRCTECHSADASLVPFSQLGYPAARIDALSDPIVFEMIENIDAGRPFEMPQFIAPQSDN